MDFKACLYNIGSFCKAIIDPLERFKRASRALLQSPGFYDDDDGYYYCNEKRQRAKDGRAVRRAMACADEAYLQAPYEVLSELSRMIGWGDRNIGHGETIEAKRDRLLANAEEKDPILAHKVRMTSTYMAEGTREHWSINYSKGDRQIVDALRQSSDEMMKNGKVIEAFKGYLCLARADYDAQKRVDAANKAVDLIAPCLDAGVSEKDMAWSIYDRVQYALPNISKLGSVWKERGLGKHISVFKHSRLDHCR